MNYHNITTDDMNNGDGLRVVLWLAGCKHHCEGCQNPLTWDPNGGLPFDEKAKEELFEKLDKPYISGITFSGGDPLHYHNWFEVRKLCKEIKEKFPGKTIWIYTGYTWENIKIFSRYAFVTKYADVLVDGRFEEDKKDVNYPWAGSTNQRVIDIQKTRKEGCVVLWKSK